MQMQISQCPFPSLMNSDDFSAYPSTDQALARLLRLSIRLPSTEP